MKDIKKILLTGASGGIGRAICNKFKDNNYSLILTATSEEKIINLKTIYGENHHYFKVNLSDSENLQDFFP